MVTNHKQQTPECHSGFHHICKMNIVRKISSPQRNQDMYSSQRQLFDDDNTSDDIVVGTLHNLKPKSHINNAFELEETNTKVPVQAFVEIQELEIIDDDEKDDTSCDILKISSSSDIQEEVIPKVRKHKTGKQKHNLVKTNTNVETYVSPSIFNSKTNGDKTSIKSALKSLNLSDDELFVGKISDSNIENTDDSSEISSKFKAKSKRTPKKKRELKNLIETESFEMETIKHTPNKNISPVKLNRDSKIIGLHIIGSEILENHLFLNKPSVKVYIVDYKTETVICKMNDSEQNLDIVAQTKPFDFRQNCTIVPKWNEILLLDTEIIEKIKSLKSIIIFFEIVDEVQNIEENSGITSFQTVSWAFIKPLGHNDSSNMNKKLKLQLYEVDQSQINDTSNVYEWYSSKPWKKYPSVLNVVVMSLLCNNYTDKINSIKLAIMSNNREETLMKSKKYVTSSQKSYAFDNYNMQKRSSEEYVEIPNTIVSILNNANGNTTMIKFSMCGRYLAYSALENNKYIIYIYKVPELKEIMKLSHHKGLVYDICWNNTSTQLITASADSMAFVWNVADHTKCTRQKLHHSSFVYTAKFCKSNENIIATGCYDTIIRIWILESNSESADIKYNLSDELTGHSGYVNAINFLDYSEMFYSADSEGTILKWAKGKDGWVKLLDINVEEFKGKIINDLVLFPDSQRMLVIIRNDTSWSLIITSTTTFTCYKNGILNRYQARGCLSPCGTFVLIGSNIWSAATGELCAMLSPVQFDHHPIMSLDFHPFYNLMALSCGRKNTPLVLCYHIHKLDVDPNLGMEIYASNMINCNKVDVSDNKIVLERIVEKMDGEELKFNKTPNKNVKLWDLLRKMDDLLKRAKQTSSTTTNKKEEKINAVKETTVDLNLKSPNSDSSNILSVNLTDFYEKMNKLKLTQERELDTSLTESDTLNSLGTYTLENEKPVKMKKVKRIKHLSRNEQEGSSTLSNGESLDEDQNTYTISPNN